MAGPAQSYIESLPPAQAQLVNGILERLPAAQRPAALQTCRELIARSGDSAGEALRRLASIMSHERFTPSMLGTVSLMAARAGPNVVSTLSGFEQLLSLDKFNRHVHEAARLAVIRAGEDSNEALLALRYLVDNPSFAQSLGMALPDRFIGFLDSAIRSGGDQAYMSIRALGSLFCNSSFTPADLTPRFAAMFGRWMSSVREAGRLNRLDALEAFSTVLANSAINPRDITPETARTVASMANLVVEYTRPYEANGSSVEGSMRALRLILGHRRFSLDMIAGGGMLQTFLNLSDVSIPHALPELAGFFRAARREPRAFGILSQMLEGENPMGMLRLLTAVVSNPSLVRLIDDENFLQSISPAILALNSGHLIPSSSYLTDLARNPAMTADAWRRTLSFVESLGERADVGMLLLVRCLSNSRPFPTEAELGNIGALARQIDRFRPGMRYEDYDNIALAIDPVLSLPAFRPSMLEPEGLIPTILRRCTADEAHQAFNRLLLIMGRGNYRPDMEPLLLELARASRRADGSGARFSSLDNLNAFWRVMTAPGFDRRAIPHLREAIRGRPGRAGVLISAYDLFVRSRTFSDAAASRAFIRRVSRLTSGIGIGEEGADFLQALESLLADWNFTPRMLRSVEALVRVAGPSSAAVLRAVVTAKDSVPLSTLLSWDTLQFYAGLVLAAPRESRASVGEALGQVLRAEDIHATPEPRVRRRIIESYRAFLEGAGPRAGVVAAAFIPILGTMLSDTGPFPTILYQRIYPSRTRLMGRWARAYVDSLPPSEHGEAASSSDVFSAMLSSRPLYNMITGSPERYLAGQRLARSLIGGFVPPDICFNFAYAIETIGAERASLLYRRFGIRHFARYSPEMLTRLYERAAGRSDRPVVLAVFPESDWNGAFYQEGRQLDSLLGRYDVIIYERQTEEGFYGAIRDFSRRYGRTRTLIIGGHGTPNTIRLGSEMEPEMLDMTDTEELPAIRSVLEPNPSVILLSCSTGKSERAIGGVISRILGARLYAPVDPGNVSTFTVARDGSVSASYNVDTGVFAAGQKTED